VKFLHYAETIAGELLRLMGKKCGLSGNGGVYSEGVQSTTTTRNLMAMAREL